MYLGSNCLRYVNYINHESYGTGQFYIKIDNEENIVGGVEYLPKWWKEEFGNV